MLAFIFQIFLVRIPAWIFQGMWFLYQLIEANFGPFNAKANGGGVAFFAHVGGFIFGPHAGPVFGHLLLGLVDLAARSDRPGVAWADRAGAGADRGHLAVIAGVAGIAAAFAAGEPAGTRVLVILAGLISVAFGVVLCARSGMGRDRPGAGVRPVQPDLRDLDDPVSLEALDASRGLAPRALRDIQAGQAAGCFTVTDAEIALSAVAGGVLGLLRLRDRHQGHMDEASVDQLTEACLRLLGVPGSEAARLVASPLPPVRAVSR